MVRRNPGSCVFTTDRFFAGSLSVVSTPVVAVAAADNSLDTVWFVKIIEEMQTDKNAVKDKYGNTIQAGQPFLSGHFLESTRHPNYYTESKKQHIFIKNLLSTHVSR